MKVRQSLIRIMITFVLAGVFLFGIRARAASETGEAAESGEVSVPDESSELRITVIDFGEEGWGDGAMIESNGECMLMDTYLPDCGETLTTFLKDHGYTKFSMYLSHYHADHFGNMQRIMKDEDFTVTRLYLPKDDYMTTTPGDYENNMNWFTSMDHDIRDKAKELDIPITDLQGGDSFMIGDAKVEVLYGPNFDSDDHNRTYLNSNSLVTRITGGGIRFLTCGDIEKPMERQTIDAGIDLDADILKLNHHGGDTSNSWDFIEAVDPSFAYFDYMGDSPNHYAMDWASEGAATAMEFANVHSVRYNGTIVYRALDGIITVHCERNMVPQFRVYTPEGGGIIATYQMFNDMSEPIETEKMKAAEERAAQKAGPLIPKVYK